MTEAAVPRIEQLGNTVFTHCDIGWDWRLRNGVRLARHNPEPVPVRGIDGDVVHGDGTDARERRSLGTQPATEFVDTPAFSLHLEKHCARIVADEPGETELARDSVDERTKANPLDDTGHGEVLADVLRPEHQGGIGHVNRPPG